MKNNKLKIISNIFSFLIFEILFIIFNLSFAPSASAQGISVGIDPPIIQIEAKAPAIINSGVTIQNESDQTITYNIFLMPFNSSFAKNGEVEFDKSLLPKYSNLFKTVQVSERNRVITEVKLAPRQSKNLNLRIAVAAGQPASDYYFSVLFISEENANSGESSFTGARAGIATNVLLSLGPKSKTQGHIRQFSAPGFVTKGPVEFTLNVANTSTHFVTIKGNLLIKNVFGQTVGNIDLLPVNILAGSERFLGSPRIFWNEKFLLGIYKADLTVALSEEGPILKKSLTFFAFPAELILGLITGLILTIGIVRRVKKKQTE